LWGEDTASYSETDGLIKKEDICLVGYAALYSDRNLPRFGGNCCFCLQG
jgi:hypothetical protein